jgi:hypothetical protein
MAVGQADRYRCLALLVNSYGLRLLDSMTLFVGLFWDSGIGYIDDISAAAGIWFRPDGRPPLFRQRGETILR